MPSHLAYKKDIDVLAECRDERMFEILSVDLYLALVDKRLLLFK